MISIFKNQVKIILVLILLLSTFNTMADDNSDVIHLKNGKQVIGKIINSN